MKLLILFCVLAATVKIDSKRTNPSYLKFVGGYCEFRESIYRNVLLTLDSNSSP